MFEQVVFYLDFYDCKYLIIVKFSFHFKQSY